MQIYIFKKNLNLCVPRTFVIGILTRSIHSRFCYGLFYLKKSIKNAYKTNLYLFSIWMSVRKKKASLINVNLYVSSRKFIMSFALIASHYIALKVLNYIFFLHFNFLNWFFFMVHFKQKQELENNTMVKC